MENQGSYKKSTTVNLRRKREENGKLEKEWKAERETKDYKKNCRKRI